MLSTKINSTSTMTTESVSNTSDNALENPIDQIGRRIICGTCLKENSSAKLCSRCKTIYYCNEDCQRKSWQLHKKLCSFLSKIPASVTLKLIKLGNWDTPVFSSQNSCTAENSLYMLSDLAEELSSFLTNQALELINRKIEADHTLRGEIFQIPSQTFLKASIQNLTNLEAEAQKEGDPSSICTLLTKLKEFALKYFNEPCRTLISFDTSKLDGLTLVKTDMINRLWRDSISQYPNYVLKEINISNFPSQFSQVLSTRNLTNVNCIVFAFLLIGEKNILNTPSVNPDTLLKTLNDWNYHPVSEPQAGDLVAYFDRLNQPQHLGVLTNSLTVRSKPGYLYPFTVEHPLFDVSHHQGKCHLAFFRKKING